MLKSFDITLFADAEGKTIFPVFSEDSLYGDGLYSLMVYLQKPGEEGFYAAEVPITPDMRAWIAKKAV